MTVLYIIGGIFGYIIAGLLITLLFPIYVNLWAMATFEFEKFYYDWDYVIDFFDSTSDEDILIITLYMVFWPIAIAIALILLPFVFCFNLIKFLIHLPANLIEKAAQKAQDEENYRNHVEYQYKKIMERERANDFKDYRW